MRRLDAMEVPMKRSLLTVFAATLLSMTVLAPSTASADIFSLWARGDTLVLKGGDGLGWFEKNEGLPSFGFGVGGEVLFFDAFLDANFFTDGAQWNQLGLGFDIDVVPIDLLTVAPTAQVMYFFARQSDDSPADKGLHGRAGLQVGINFLKVMSFNVEGFIGYVLGLPDLDTAPTYSGGANLMVKFSLF